MTDTLRSRAEAAARECLPCWNSPSTMSSDGCGADWHWSECPARNREAVAAALVAFAQAEVAKEREATNAARDVLRERARQQEREGEDYSAEHDDGHDLGDLALAAAAYCLCSVAWTQQDEFGSQRVARFRQQAARLWPWDEPYSKPNTKDARQDLVRAGALVLAELERIDRARASAQEQPEGKTP
jgi:hypothetical protein